MQLQFFSNPKIITKGFDNISFDSNSLIISNHLSMNDVYYLDSILPDNVLFAIYENEKKSLLNLNKNRNTFLYNPLSPQSLVELKNLIEGEHPVLIFPEVIASPHRIVSRIYNEISDLIRRTNPKIYPICMSGGNVSNYTPHSELKIELYSPFSIDISSFEKKDIANKFISDSIYKKLQDFYFKQCKKEDVNLYNELLIAAKRSSDKKVIIEDPNSQFTYKDFLLSVNVFYQKLKPMLSDEKNIGVLLPSSGANLLTLFSLFKLGKVPAMLNFSMGVNSLIDCVNVAEIKTVLSSRAFVEQGDLHHLIEGLEKTNRIIYLEDLKESIQANEKFLGYTQFTLNTKADKGHNEIILFTSGSESKPKGVVLSHDNIFNNIYQCLSVINIDTEKDSMFNVLPMFHSFGLTAGSLLPVLIGLPVFLYPSPLHHRLIPELIYQKQSTIMFGTSTFFSMYGKDAHPNSLQSLRLAVAGGEKLKDDVYDTWFSKFGVKIVEGYGVTEAAPVLSINTPLSNKMHSIGRLLPNVEYSLEAVEGINGFNLLVKGPNLMKGYLLHEEGFVPHEGWYKTGDVVQMDEDGFLQVISRLKRFSKIGGEMVSLNLVEEIAFETYGSTSFAAVSIPDKRKGEKIVLFTSLQDTNLKDFKKTLKLNKHSSLLLPKEIFFIDSIPLLGSGKTDYVSLQKLATEIF